MILLLVACAPDLSAVHVWNDGVVYDTAAGEGPVLVETVPEGEGFASRIDARHPANWVAIDFDAGATDPVPLEDGTWDLRFQRFQVSVNGGISGDAGGEAAFVADLALGAANEAPTTGWQTDAPDGPDEASDPDYALYTWYLYDEDTHVLTPDAGVWFVRATTGGVYALSIDSYYDENGDSGVFTIRWKGPLAGGE